MRKIRQSRFVTEGGVVLSIICTAIFIFSTVCAMFTGQANRLSASILEGASAGVQLAITLAGPLCLWSGLCTAMEAAGLSERLSHLIRPLLRRLFPQACGDDAARKALCGNLAANLLGLGNAATPMGIAAVQRMRQLSGTGCASDEMCRFIVLNTASVQLLPLTVTALRSNAGAVSPMDILPAVWVTSLCSVIAGLGAAALFSRWYK